MTKAVAVAGAAFFAVGCLLGVIGLGTTSWEVLPTKYLSENSTGTGNDIILSRGLWETCSIRRNTFGKGPCKLKAIASAEMGADAWVLRVVICIGNFLSLLTFVFIVIWVLGDSCRESYGWRSLVFIFSSLSAFLTLMPTFAYGARILVSSSQFTIGWSFGIAIVGALLLGPGNFLLCQHAHHMDHEDQLLYEKHTQSRNEMGEFRDHADPHTSYM